MSSEEEEIPDEVYLAAVLNFGKKFSEYVKEMDKPLWERAIAYAKDFVEVEGYEVIFDYIETEDDDVEEAE
tara:strand:+ start:349 stop:561 length:213 start_codon:yes stop_codon:yes gene_type:complete